MPRHFKNSYDAIVYRNHRLPAIQARIESDIQSALARCDFVRAHRYALRLYLVENRFWTVGPSDISTYSDFR